MGKSSNGPDWTDVSMMMGALETLHGVRVGLTAIPAGQGQNGQLSICLSCFVPSPGAENGEAIVQVMSEFPCKECTELAQHVYGGLYKLDFAIGEAYKQRVLPEC